MIIKIRKSHSSDFEPIFSIWLANQVESTGNEIKSSSIRKLKKQFLELFENKNCHFIVGVSLEKIIVAWQVLTPLLSNPLIGKYTAQISTYTKPDISIPGIGNMLTNKTIELARKRGVEQIYGWVKTDNRPANLLGFRYTKQKYSLPGSKLGNIPDFNLYIIDIH